MSSRSSRLRSGSYSASGTSVPSGASTCTVSVGTDAGSTNPRRGPLIRSPLAGAGSPPLASLVSLGPRAPARRSRERVPHVGRQVPRPLVMEPEVGEDALEIDRRLGNPGCLQNGAGALLNVFHRDLTVTEGRAPAKGWDDSMR